MFFNYCFHVSQNTSPQAPWDPSKKMLLAMAMSVDTAPPRLDKMVPSYAHLKFQKLTCSELSSKNTFTSENHHPGKRKLKHSSFPFIFFNDSIYTSISFYPDGELNIIGIVTGQTAGPHMKGAPEMFRQPLPLSSI